MARGGVLRPCPISCAPARCTTARRLSGGSHHVHTGVVLLVPCIGAAASVPPGPGDELEGGWLVRTFATSTEVTFDELSDDTLDNYVKSGGR